MNKLKVLIREGEYLWKPIVLKNGRIKVGGPFCITCRIKLEQKQNPLDKYETFIHYVKCKKETVLDPFDSAHFKHLPHEIEVKLAAKDLENYKVIALDELPEKESKATREHRN